MNRSGRAWCATFVLLAGLTGCGGIAKETPPSQGSIAPQVPPAKNAIVLCIDTLRTSRMHCYGNDRETTPAMDALSRAGVKFDNVVAHSNWTVPATASLMTSTYPFQHGAGVEGDVRNLGKDSPVLQIRQDIETIADVLSRKGFTTALLSGNPYLYGRFKSGFDLANVRLRPAHQITDELLEFVHSAGDERFFAWVQYMDLHHPLTPPDEYFNHFDAGVPGERGDQHRNWSFGEGTHLDTREFKSYRAQRLAAYDGTLLYVDTEIQRLVDALASMGLAEDTLIVITADHGEEFWDHAREERELQGDPRGIYGIGHGHSMYQELIGVPLILSGAGVPVQGDVSNWVGHVDVAPTILDMLGFAKEPQMEGTSLVDGLRGASDLPSSLLLSESPAYGPNSSAVIRGGWKLITRSDGHRLLFQLERDPTESSNVAGQHPEVVAKLAQLIETSSSAEDATERSASHQADEETLEQLRTLGYIE